MELPDLGKITTDKIDAPFLQTKNVQLDVLRLDKIHPVISGNKWFKLKYHLENFNAGNYNGIITFGGAWSNHIVATACTCYLQKIKCIGIIRGEKPQQLSATLIEADKYEMELKFISREKYSQKNSAEFIESIKKEFPRHYIIPEGGAGKEGEKGSAEILQYTNWKNYTHIACAVGTGTMFNGIKLAALPNQNILGIVVLKGWKEKNEPGNAELYLNYHFGGYAKYDQVLIDFMNDFFKLTNIPTDFVYTGKLVYSVLDLIKKDHFPPTSKILMIHSGGLQGNVSLQKGSLIF
jgi:1-aminocyclopropane-1-carboxylate deaminase/D-cysteine desulfhydrase-like pyridoxal-dependent ACC family enzyme